MKIDEEQELLVRVDKKVRDGMEVIFENIWNVEDHILELFKVAGCVFDKEMFESLLLDFRVFDTQSGNFETMASQITNPIMTISEAMTMDLMMKKLSETMDRLVNYINTCNNIVQQHTFDIRKANLLSKLEDKFPYDTVHYDDLSNAVEHPYLVVITSDVLDTDYPNKYYPLHVLGLRSFDNKIDAMKYCLANKISRDNIILRY